MARTRVQWPDRGRFRRGLCEPRGLRADARRRHSHRPDPRHHREPAISSARSSPRPPTPRTTGRPSRLPSSSAARGRQVYRILAKHRCQTDGAPHALSRNAPSSSIARVGARSTDGPTTEILSGGTRGTTTTASGRRSGPRCWPNNPAARAGRRRETSTTSCRCVSAARARDRT